VQRQAGAIHFRIAVGQLLKSRASAAAAAAAAAGWQVEALWAGGVQAAEIYDWKLGQGILFWVS